MHTNTMEHAGLISLSRTSPVNLKIGLEILGLSPSYKINELGTGHSGARAMVRLIELLPQ